MDELPFVTQLMRILLLLGMLACIVYFLRNGSNFKYYAWIRRLLMGALVWLVILTLDGVLMGNVSMPLQRWINLGYTVITCVMFLAGAIYCYAIRGVSMNFRIGVYLCGTVLLLYTTFQLLYVLPLHVQLLK